MLVNCVICSDLFGAADEVSITPCGHLFHFICVTHWLSRAKTCPQCRAKTTDQTIRRVYFNISNNQNEEEEAGSLQNKVDTLSFDVRLKGVEIKKLEESNNTLKNQTQGLKVEIKKLEEKLSTQAATAAALKQQVQFFQGESKDAIKSKNECKRLRNQLENLQNVDTIVHGTVDEVDQLLQNYTVSSDSIRSLATFVSVLKKEMKTLTDKRKELRDSLRALDMELRNANTEKDQLSSQLSTLKLTNKQLEEDLKHLENTKRSMQKKIEKLEEAIMSPTEGNPRDKALRRLIAESPAPEELKKPRLSNPSSEFLTPTRPNQSTVPETNAQPLSTSPRLKVKASSIGLAPLRNSHTNQIAFKANPNGSAPMNHTFANSFTANKFSIFNKRRVVNPAAPSTSLDGETSYDGLGGHSKLDVFPNPVRKIPIKKTKSLSKFKNMASNETLKLDNYFDLT